MHRRDRPCSKAGTSRPTSCGPARTQDSGETPCRGSSQRSRYSTLDDLVFRRTTLWEDPEGTASAAGELALLFGWGPSRAEQERSRLSLRLATMCAPVGRRPGFAEVADPAIVLEKKKA
jgi:hypothetical protein